MRKKLNLKNLGRFTRGKVVTALLVAGIALVFSWFISRVLFSGIENSVTLLAAPNERLMIVNRLLEKVSRLDQLQRIQALKQPQAARSFLKETQQIRLTLDTLSEIYEGSELIRSRIDSMQLILLNRDKVYVAYISLRANQQSNPQLSKQLESITNLVKQNARQHDSTVVTTENKITTLAAPKKQQEQSFWKRLFGKKQKQEPEEFVREEVNITIDTISVARQNRIVKDIDDAVKRMEKDQAVRNNTMLLQELDLVNNGNSLINELWNLLHKIQEEELSNVRNNTSSTIDYFNNSINRAGIVLMLFFLVICALVYTVLTDLAKSNRYREELQQAKEEAEHASVMKQRFLANMSHEIRTPLQSIIGFSEQVKHQQKPQPKMLEAIHTSAEHLLHIVNEILDYSRIISGKFVLENRPFNLHKLVEEVAGNMQLQAESKELSFTLVNKTDPSVNISGDDFRIKQVLYNLLGNAIKFTNTGGIVFKAVQEQTQYILSVTDSGPGISEENIARIFNEFEQTDESVTRKFGGTGLGLSISRSLVETMGGLIEVTSEMEIGSTFSVILPLAVTEKPTVDAPELTPGHSYTSIRTIVVDDDPFILSLCDTILSSQQIEHACYSSAEELLNTDWNHSTKLVFTDMRLPGKNGVELMKTLKERTENVRFVALTAHVLPEEKARLISEGFDAILSKPFRQHELLSFFEKALHAEIDLSLLKKMTMNDEELLRSHLDIFIEETTQDVADLKRNMHHNRQHEAYELIHRLAGRVGLVGANHLMKQLRTLEHALSKAGDLERLINKLENVIEQIEELLREIKTRP